MTRTFTSSVEMSKKTSIINTTWCNIKHMSSWSEEEIIDYYDTNPDMTIKTYAQNLNISELELKNILLK